jgi:carboxyl-terminal processing protease
MTQNTIRLFSFIVVLMVSIFTSQAHAGLKNGQLECAVLRPIAQGFLSNHVAARKLDLEHEGRTIERFIKTLDPQKIYLRDSDAAEIRAALRGSFKVLGEDCSGIEKAYQVYVNRLSAASTFAKKQLSGDFKFNEGTELVFDPNLRKFPSNDKEAEEQLSKYIQFQISNYLASDMKLPQAKKQLIHRYELTAKR